LIERNPSTDVFSHFRTMNGSVFRTVPNDRKFEFTATLGEDGPWKDD